LGIRGPVDVATVVAVARLPRRVVPLQVKPLVVAILSSYHN